VTRFLLDTNIISDVFKNPEGRAVAGLRAYRTEEIGTSLIVAGEIRYGLVKNRNMRGLERLEMFLGAITVWPLESAVDEAYAEFRHAAARSGVGIGANDLWIAAHAAVLSATLVTNDRAFGDIPGLTVENWLRP
jgi:tRNA(fMet)-specific endonuclease VapC